MVLWSSGVVYGAHADNPVPLHESDPTRPNPDFPAAGVLADIEGIALERSRPDRAVVVLRGARVWAPAWGTFLARRLMGPALIGVGGRTRRCRRCTRPTPPRPSPWHVGRGPRGVYNVAPADVGARQAAAADRRRLVSRSGSP